ncbi:MAG: tetratricopeptide repeat protein [Armatimonadetes bacterium]|nr:tetratricopeptide repeat protein [Armatimonadota bacterium]
MRRCEDCKLILESDARFCPKCGKSVTEAPQHEPADVRLAVLLTSANVHRVKGEWDAAVSDATAALEIDPNNADVASLLASIYEQRGNLDEAAIWYKIAADLDPRNIVHQANLQRVTLASRPRFHRWTKRQRIAITAAAAVLLVVITVFVTLALSIGGERLPAPRRAGRPPAGRAQIKAPSTTPAPATTPTTSSVSGSGLAMPSSSSARTPGEAALKSRLGADESVRAAGAIVDDVIFDPRQGVVSITFSLPSATPWTRVGILTTAFNIVRAAFAANAEIRSVTVRCVISPQGPSSTQIAFVGDVSRTTMNGLGTNPTEVQLNQAFTAQWWNPLVK